MQEFDVVVIGGGSAGYQAAVRASQLGAKVCVIEKDFLGGTCLNKGCIPTKSLRECAQVLYTVKRANTFGIKISDFLIDFSKCKERKDKIIQRLRRGIDYLFKNYRVELIKGKAYIKNPNVVEIELPDGSFGLKAKHVIVATGSRPNKSIFGENYINIISSDEVLDLSNVPKSILVVGGGVIGCEFACIFRELGSEVTIVEAMPHILSGEDEEVASSLTNILTRKGVRICTGTKVKEVESSSSYLVSKLDNGEQFQVEKIIVAIGRLLNTENVGLEKVGIETKEGKILVNRNMRTNIPCIYAAGDITGKPFLAHLAFFEGIVAAENACGKEKVIDYSAIPKCIYTHPEIASIGLTQKEAEDLYPRVKVAKVTFIGNGRALTLGEREGFIKILSSGNEEKILGVHIIGPQASELINIVSLAMSRRLRISDLVSCIYAHPTLAESIKESAEKVLTQNLQ